MDGRKRLSQEATIINAAFSQQVLARASAGDKSSAPSGGTGAAALGVEMEENPFWDSEEATDGHVPASLAYRYRKV